MEFHPLAVQKKVMDEIFQGCISTAELQRILRELNSLGHDRSNIAEDLTRKILRSFTEALSKLSSIDSSEVPARTYEGSEDSRINSTNNKRRKRPVAERGNVQDMWTEITSVPIDDGFTWQKYGQKKILNAKHLRCYFKCAYKDDQGCQATKRVERIKDDPPTFWTKYIGHHTCQDFLKASFMESTNEEGLLIKFASNTSTKQEPIFSLSFLSTREEHRQISTPKAQDYSPSSYLGDLPLQDSINFKPHMTKSTSPSSTLHDDFVSGCPISPPSISDIDMELIESFNLSQSSFP